MRRFDTHKRLQHTLSHSHLTILNKSKFRIISWFRRIYIFPSSIWRFPPVDTQSSKVCPKASHLTATKSYYTEPTGEGDCITYEPIQALLSRSIFIQSKVDLKTFTAGKVREYPIRSQNTLGRLTTRLFLLFSQAYIVFCVLFARKKFFISFLFSHFIYCAKK